MQRIDGRTAGELRPLQMVPGIAPAAAGSVLVAAGNTRVICTAMVEETVPRWMKEQQISGGWVTAEYSMLPYSTVPRKVRDISRGKIDGRSTEIQRLIGRALRSVIDLDRLGPRTLWLDCDVLQADGGTRTAAVTGACVAAALAFGRMIVSGTLSESPLRRLVAAISVGIVDAVSLLDLNYEEDKVTMVDLNLVMTDEMRFVEIQGAGEETTFSQEQFLEMIELGRRGISMIFDVQRQAIATATQTI
jgi:ribonuclease PH